jgi:hypothetical protein
MSLIEEYDNALQAIYDHVGLKEDWVVCPLDSKLDCYWNVDGNTVKYADSKEEFESEDGNYYEDELYTQRFYPKHVYEGKLFTLVFCDPHTDGMKWWRLFDNSKRINNETNSI